MNISPSLRQQIEATFQVVREKSSGDELVFCCPECGDKSGHRSVNLKSGLTFCFRCNKGKNDKGFFPAWAKALGYQFDVDAESAASFSREPLDWRPAVHLAIPVFKEVELPAGFTPIAREPKGVYCKLITKMARRKNLDYEDFVQAGAGFTKEDPHWEPFCIFPVTEYGRVVYYQGRTYVDAPGEPTKLFPSRQAVQYGAAYWVYNIQEVREKQPRTVVVVESILNVLSLKRKFAELGVTKLVPVCVFKHFIGRVQAEKLSGCRGVRELCFLFDHDATALAWQAAPKFVCRFKRVSVAEMPYRQDNEKLDANDDVDAAIKALEDRVYYTKEAAFSKGVRRPS